MCIRDRLKLERGPARGELFDAFFLACQQAGYALTDDLNGYRQEGFAAFDRNIYRGRRLSAARAYLHPVITRSNLTVRTRTHATRLLIKDRRVKGVETIERSILGNHRNPILYRARNVVCCAGALNTPQLLQLSGIGPKRLLEKLEIPVVADLSGVGENLQDHLEVYIQHASLKKITQQPNLAVRRRPLIGLQWLFRRGPASTNHCQAGGFIGSGSGATDPN